MSVSFYSDGVETINRQIPSDEDTFKNGMPAINLELERCVKWITDNNFSRVIYLLSLILNIVNYYVFIAVAVQLCS